ncbi:MAG TPA: ATPase, T2SS/T4P/T4SS family [Armatimonadota bacterium]|jgi:type IV pilus assembly protein PilB
MRRPGGQKQIGQMLIEKGLLNPEQLRQALETQKQTTQLIGEVLVDLGFVQRQALYETLAEQLRIPYLDVSLDTVDASVATLLSREDAERYRAIPVGREETGAIRVAMAEPGDVIAMDALRMQLQVQVSPVLGDPDAIHATIAKAFERSAANPAAASAAAPGPMTRSAGGAGGPMSMGSGGLDMQALAESVRDGSLLGTTEDSDNAEGRLEMGDRIGELADEAPIIKIAKLVIQRSIHERASDIHVEPYQNRVRVRYRIDGVLHDVLQLPKYVHAPLISRFKIMSNMNIAEKRVPQDGRMHVRHSDRDFDLRASVIPTTSGEKMVMRILDKTSIERGMDTLGFKPKMLADIERLVEQPNGMILSTGPTGSGKTTTQYNILNHILSVETNIITVEDPVEFQLDGLSQVNVNRKAGLTFAVALKYFLRQDPDIILVGEIRDLETSEIAIQAALTGHLVLSTLHTNDAPSTVTRLTDMGVEPFLISSSIICSLSQRLARRICPQCAEPYQPRRDLLIGFGFDPDASENKDHVFMHGRGCDNCRGTGYRGRIGIYELLIMNPEISELIVKRASAGQIREAALASGMTTLAEDGFGKVMEGITTVEDLQRVVFTAGMW